MPEHPSRPPGDPPAAGSEAGRGPAEPPTEPPTEPSEPTQQPAEGSTSARIGRALRSPSRRQVVVAVLLAVLGFAAVTQVRVAGQEDNYSGLRQQDLIDVLGALSGARERAEQDIDRLEGVREDLQDDTTRRRTALEEANQEAADLAVLAGTVPVTGPGIRITITEEEGTVRLSSLLDTIQELRTFGAEAMQINGVVRIVAQTSFAQTTGGFLVDGELIEPPYVIDVIGDPDGLSSALEFPLGPKKQLEEDGATLEVDELASLDIETVREPNSGGFAEPAPGE
ncbi:DUF881 domain-containing protein [Nocardioides sambongensis]|uniref:DUF881 domain-containing protein n=1 Tax=Nocardioides sambongensis TaxID=2589074 RepID=UPI00112A4680|nr:DUF881 domain-containing protein [Nocardioides sambongensis]